MKRNAILLLLVGVCFVSATKRIVGGRKATIEEFPYQVSLEYRHKPICGGSILDKFTVVTAAHCTAGKTKDDFRIRAGSTSNMKGGITIDLTDLIQHENYNETTFDKDITILKLKEPLEFTNTVKPINLPHARSQIPEGSPVNISGWGLTDSSKSESEVELRTVQVKVMSVDECAEKYAQANKEITHSMLCAGEEEGKKDACQGDSGGPLAQNNILIGVVSWGIDCASPEYPGVYTDVANMLPWIEAKLQVLPKTNNKSHNETSSNNRNEYEERQGDSATSTSITLTTLLLPAILAYFSY